MLTLARKFKHHARRRPHQRSKTSLCVSLFIQICAVVTTLSSIPLLLTQFGIIEYAHLSGNFGEYTYEITSSSNMNSPPKSGEEPGVPMDKSKTSDEVMTDAHDALYLGVLKNKNSTRTPQLSAPVLPLAQSTKLRSKSSSKTKNVSQITQDGCSANDKVVPKWELHPKPIKHTKFMNDVAECWYRTTDYEPLWTILPNATYLQCNKEASMDIIKQYRRIWFIGDSVLLQQYRSLVCMLDTQFMEHQLKGRHCGEEYTYKHDLGETTLTYTEFGYLFDKEEPLYRTVFPEALEESGIADTIVINAGLHYDVTRGDKLQQAIQFIKEQASQSNVTTSVHIMEASNQQWPTSNGIWTGKCTDTCSCEVLTPERRQGHGTWGQNHKEVSQDIGRLPLPQKSTFEHLYPDLFTQSSNSMDLAHCVPSCLPANWRNDIIHSILNENGDGYTSTIEGSSSNNVHIVPIWNQLVAQNQLHNRDVGDCTHKRLGAVHMMNEQFFRSLEKSVKPNQRQGITKGNPAPPTRCSRESDKKNDAVLHMKFKSGPLGALEKVSTTAVPSNVGSHLRVIVTGMEHTGTTILSELIMSAPGLIGPFETGFLLAEKPADFTNVEPFYQWVTRNDIPNAFLGLTPIQAQKLLEQPNHADMYSYVMENSMLFKNIPSQWYVDKTPGYVYSLRQVMERAGPGIKVVVSMKSYEAAYKSWVTRRGSKEDAFDAAYQLFQLSVQEASEAFPGQIYLQDYDNLFGQYIKGEKEEAFDAGKLLFDWLGLEWKDGYFTGKNCTNKGRPCNMASLLDH